MCVCVYTHIYDLLEWLTGQQWPSLNGKSRNPSRSVHEDGCLSCSSVCITGIPKKQALMAEKEGLSSRTDELANENEGKQAKCRSLFLPCLLYRLLWEGVVQIWGVFRPQIIQLTKNSSEVCRVAGFQLIPDAVKLTTQSLWDHCSPLTLVLVFTVF